MLVNGTDMPENVADAVTNLTTPHVEESTKRPAADSVAIANVTGEIMVDGSGHEGSTERMVSMDDRMVTHDDRSTDSERLVSGSGSGDHEDRSTEIARHSSLGDIDSSSESPLSTLKPKCERLADGKKAKEDCIDEKEGDAHDQPEPKDQKEEAKKPCCG